MDVAIREADSLHSCVAVLKGHSSPIKCIAACIDDLVNCVLIYTGNLDGEIQVWSLLVNVVNEVSD